MQISHYIEKGKQRAKRLGLTTAESTVICEKKDVTDELGVIDDTMVTCPACSMQLVKLKIKDMGLTQIPNTFNDSPKLYCQSPEGILYYIEKAEYHGCYELFKAYPNGAREKLIYP